MIKDKKGKYLSSKINNVNATRLAVFCANNTKSILLSFNEN